MSNVSHQIPYQIQQLLESLLNKRDSHILRSNYRMRLDTIRREIDSAIRKYDDEVLLKTASDKREKRKA